MPPFVKATQDTAAPEPPATEAPEPTPTYAAAEPTWTQTPVAEEAEAAPAGNDVPAVDSTRVDRTFERFSEMVTDPFKKLAERVSKRADGSAPESQTADAGAADKTLPAPVGAVAKIFNDRPELGVIATFAGGLILATLLKRLARR